MNSSIILIICVPLTFLVVYLAFVSEESRLLKTIYKRLSHINPDARKRILTLSSSKYLVTNEIIKMLEAVTGKIADNGNIKNKQRAYQKMEELAVLYAKKEGISISNMTSNSNIGRLRNVNKILSRVVMRK